MIHLRRMDEYPSDVTLSGVSYTYPEADSPVFTNLSVALPRGLVSLVGQNGTGKSTLLLLASARLQPAAGRVEILGRDSAELTEEGERNRFVSFIYQNMEFESEEPIGALMEFVHEHGFEPTRDPGLIKLLTGVLELEGVLTKRTQEVSKGELQRAIVAFSLLYGSPIIMMDEPIFALEDRQKLRVMDFLRDYSRERALSIYYSVHEFEISREYSDWVLLFYKDRSIFVGPTEQMLTRARIEEAYEFPYGMLYRKEHLYRESLSARRTPLN